MAILIKIRKKDKKFRLWSTNVDDWHFDGAWLTREEVVKFLKSRIMREARNNCKEIEDNFPNYYFGRDGRRIRFENPKELK